eukprot:1823552-Alexandrium_andersonii.AAC.1
MRRSRVAAWRCTAPKSLEPSTLCRSGRQSTFTGRLVGVESAQRTLAEDASAAVTSLIIQAQLEFQAQ